MRKPAFCIYAKTAKMISAFVFATWIVQDLFYLNPTIQASSLIQWLHSPVCVGPGGKPRRPVFSHRGSYVDCPQSILFSFLSFFYLIPLHKMIFCFLLFTCTGQCS